MTSKPLALLFSTVLISLNAIALKAQETQSDQDCKTSAITDSRDKTENIPGETIGEKMESQLFWSQDEKERRFRIMQKIYPSKPIPAGDQVYRLKEGKSITPKWRNKTTLDSYMDKNHIQGVVVLKDDKIRLEKYADSVNKHTVWTSFSMAKSVSSMLLGVALKVGDIESLDDSLQQYIPAFKGHDYGKVTVRQLLTMTSGIAWNEDYEDEDSDVAQMYLNSCEGEESHILTYMKPLKFAHKPGEYWNYSTGETDLLGILIQKATGKTLGDYLSEKIWKPWGMQHCAYWIADECSGLNIGGSGLSATLRDYARLGTLMLHDGKRDNGKSLLAGEWLDNATSLLYKTDEDDNGGYGYLWWRNTDGSYMAIGIFGQMIYINPDENLVIAQFAAWPKATSDVLTAKRQDFINAVQRGID